MIISSTSSQFLPKAENDLVDAGEDQTLNMMCFTAGSISDCSFFIPGEASEVILNPATPRSDNFRYSGDGLERGQCGIRILRVDKKYNGMAVCSLRSTIIGTKANVSISIRVFSEFNNSNSESQQERFNKSLNTINQQSDEVIEGKAIQIVSFVFGAVFAIIFICLVLQLVAKYTESVENHENREENQMNSIVNRTLRENPEVETAISSAAPEYEPPPHYSTVVTANSK